MHLAQWCANCCHQVRQKAEQLPATGGMSAGFLSVLALLHASHSTVLHGTLLVLVMHQSQVVEVPLVVLGCAGMVLLTAKMVALLQC